MQKVSKAEKMLDALVMRNTITKEGRDWLVAALDPFHDLDHQLAGYPDSDTSKTIVSTYQYALDVSKDPALPAGNWDAHVFTLPYVGAGGITYNNVSTIVANGINSIKDAPGPTRSIVNIIQAPAGGVLFPATAAEYAASISTNIPVSSSLFTGTCTRVLAMAVEVVDTTADMYKQGAITAYRLPQMSNEGTTTFIDVPNTLITNLPYKTYCAPPRTVAAALSLNGSRQWAMADGAYSVVTQSTVANPLKSSSHVCPYLAANGHRGITCEIGAYDPIRVNVDPVPSTVTPSETMTFPFNTSGLMLTGLNSNSTFRIKFKIVVEMAPQPWQPDLVVLASPSAPYDPTVLEAYSKILSNIPVAVMVNDNAFGDWFSGIMRVLSKIALPISAALTPIFPLAPVVGSVVAAGSELATRIVDSSKKNDKLVAKPSSKALQTRVNRPRKGK